MNPVLDRGQDPVDKLFVLFDQQLLPFEAL